MCQKAGCGRNNSDAKPAGPKSKRMTQDCFGSKVQQLSTANGAAPSGKEGIGDHKRLFSEKEEQPEIIARSITPPWSVRERPIRYAFPTSRVLLCCLVHPLSYRAPPTSSSIIVSTATACCATRPEIERPSHHLARQGN